MTTASTDRRLEALVRQLGRAHRTSPPPPPPPRERADTYTPHRIDLDSLGPGVWQSTPEGPVFAIDRAVGADESRAEPHAALDVTWATMEVVAPTEPGPRGLAGAAFLDTETTGLGGGTGTWVFLVGIAYFEGSEPRVRQYLLDSPAREAAMLYALAEFLRQFEALVTYNGTTFDLPLLETRYITARMRPPVSSLPHLDLLTAARRLYRGRLPSCRLQELERELLGLFRNEDEIPGFEVPSRYFHYLRTGRLEPLRDVITHNFQDVVSLMSIAAYVARLVQEGPENARDALGLARVHERAKRHRDAAAIYSLALGHALSDRDRREARRRLATAHRRNGDWDAAAAAWQAAIDDDEPFSITPHLQLARYHERHRKDPAEALACLHRALQVVDRAARLAPAWAADERAKLGSKIERLERRVARLR